jgi:hypothetical protein
MLAACHLIDWGYPHLEQRTWCTWPSLNASSGDRLYRSRRDAGWHPVPRSTHDTATATFAAARPTH